MIDVCINYIPSPENFFSQIILGTVAVLTVGLGGGIYLVANLEQDLEMVLWLGSKKTNLPIALVRGILGSICR